MNPYDAAHKLAKAIRESAEFKEYKSVKEVVDQVESKKTISDEFRKTQLEVQAMRAMGQDVSDEQMEKLHNLYNLVSADEQVKNLVQLEQRLGQMLSDVHKIIGDALKTD
ncbi:MAG: YlbF family regulator [Bacillota bacterium]|nr:YlbF family regulator [Bacillota bacterium]MDD3297613.1 YlbF family regulator [Bacillota bacterium]MDD3851439.1 YlbF family regulator [Bacillota bacterium]MDD4707464.1 YlbF family regulator [Bacillota bacterium]